MVEKTWLFVSVLVADPLNFRDYPDIEIFGIKYLTLMGDATARWYDETGCSKIGCQRNINFMTSPQKRALHSADNYTTVNILLINSTNLRLKTPSSNVFRVSLSTLILNTAQERDVVYSQDVLL